MVKRRYTEYRRHESYETKGSSSPSAPHHKDYLFVHTGLDDLQISQGNPVHKLGDSRGSIGGEFLVVRHIANQEFSLTGHKRIQGGSSIPSGKLWYHNGCHFAKGNIGVNDWPTPIVPSLDEMDEFGTLAIANTIPTNPVSDLANTLGEIKLEGIPTLPVIHSWRERTSRARKAGGEYLNHQFGWLPLVNEIRNFSTAVTRFDELVAQYDRNSGKRIKRSFELPAETSVEYENEQVGGGFTHILPDPNLDVRYYIGSNGTTKRTTRRTIERRMWFEGAFTYYIPPYNPNGSNAVRNIQLAQYLFGLEVTPETLWNLAPWTWAADWVGNTGNVLHNLSAFRQDGLVMSYGYVMQTTIHKSEITLGPVVFKTYPEEKHFLTSSISTVVKRRRKATPYGFGLTFDGFSAHQLAILAALGLSKG